MDIMKLLENSNRILFAGIGGGFDIFGALPLYYKIRDKKVIFSNYNASCKEFCYIPQSYPEKDLDELLLSVIPFYMIPKNGVQSQLKHYKQIIEDNNIDTIVAVDGGVDSLMHGDEEDSGTILEDFVSMIALNELKVENKILSCIGFGTELEEGVCHHHVLENIAQLCKEDGFLGCEALIKGSEEFEFYKFYCEEVWKKGRKSHIHTKIISSIMGYFGEENLYDGVEANVVSGYEMKNYLTPLMNLYWFFNLDKVVKNNILANKLRSTISWTDVLLTYRQFLNNNGIKRGKYRLPL